MVPLFENCLKKKLKVPPTREDFPAADVYQNRVSLLKKMLDGNYPWIRQKEQRKCPEHFNVVLTWQGSFATQGKKAILC